MAEHKDLGGAFLELIISTVLLLSALLHLRRLQMNYASFNRRTYRELQQFRSEKENMYQRLESGGCTKESTSYSLLAARCTDASETFTFFSSTQ